MMICKKKILSAMVLMGTASTLMAQTTVKGRVTDQNGEPVIGATVSLNGQAKSLSVTDVNGNYQFTTKNTLGKQDKIVFSFCRKKL